MIPLLSIAAPGYVIVIGIVILAVAIFTMIQLRKQVLKRKKEEKRKQK